MVVEYSQSNNGHRNVAEGASNSTPAQERQADTNVTALAQKLTVRTRMSVGGM
jgi:hypothetical protein